MVSVLGGGVTLIEPVQDQKDYGRDDKAEDEAEKTQDERPLLFFFPAILPFCGNGGSLRSLP